MLINHDFTQDRRKYLGGSDIGAILGVSKYKTPLDVWMEKTGKAENAATNLPIRFGHFAEEFVAQEYVRATGYQLLKSQGDITHSEHPFLMGHVDRFVVTDTESSSICASQGSTTNHLLECKTANPYTLSQWGEAGSDEVPLSYLAQCHWYLCITQLARCDLAVLFGNSEFRIYRIHADRELQNALVDKAVSFWQEHVLKNIPPAPQSTLDCQVLFKNETAGKAIEAQAQTAALIAQFTKLTEQIHHAELQVEAIKKSVMENMQDAQELTYQGQVLATWKKPKPSLRFDTKRFEHEHPELVSLYQKPIQNSRRLVIKPWQDQPSGITTQNPQEQRL